MGIDKILIADNDFAFVNRLKNGLQQFGQFIVLTAPDGKHALRLLTTQKISLVVADLGLPKMDGIELLAAMSRQFSNVLSIISTSLQSGELKKQKVGDSLYSYLNKPFDHVRLHNEIIKALDCRDEVYFKAGIFPSSLLPLVHLSKKTCLLELQTKGAATGAIVFQEGRIHDVSCGNLTGSGALDEILGWDPCKYWCKELNRQYPGRPADEILTARIMAGTGVESTLRESERTRTRQSPESPRSVQPPPEERGNPPGSSSRCRVAVVDDSELMRKALRKILAGEPGIEITGEAADGKEALTLIKQTRPDVVILDLQLHGMDGMTTLKHMMIQSPTPAIMLSAVTHEGAAVTFETLKYGAVDFMAKPSNIVSRDMDTQLKEIISRIRHAAGMKIESAQYVRTVSARKKTAAGNSPECRRVVCMGTAEGGYGALLKIIPKLASDSPAAYFVILHAIPQHVDAFINYLDRHCAVRIARAVNGAPVEGATCYLVSGKENVALAGDGSGRIIMRVKPAPPESGRKSINALMFSMAKMFGEKAVGIVLSGAGDDGSAGLQEIKKAGGRTMIQNPAYCLYKEMVENARKHVGKSSILTESKIADTLNKICRQDL